MAVNDLIEYSEVVGEIEARGVESLFIKADVSSSKQVHNMIEEMMSTCKIGV